ncbi:MULTISPECIES: hypothetical protein [unclassified Nostoc]|uniref:hypothetical protein n=1 Tax=unclassified Nostoc TaxID=2593658 RepID=UPI00261BC86C|nr:hypothetical protein [Nostoc sp. S13]MDF5738007.1 hypothetical protein [Nostoc sp. S13]
MNKVAIVLTLMMILGACIVLINTRIKTKTIVYGNDGLYGGIILQANGSTTETIQLKDVSNRSLNTKVELKVRRGTVYLELLDDKGQPTSSLVATPGKPALSKGYLVADVSSVVKYRITAIEAQNIEYSFIINDSD